MFYGDNRNDIRQAYFSAWHAAVNKRPLDALQQQIVEVIRDHPEYHNFLSQPDNIDKDFTPEMGQTNPFLHMGMHMAIREQLSIDRPSGIRTIYQRLLSKCADPHDTEHRMMECLGEILWQAQSGQRAPDMDMYITRLQALTR